MAFSAIALLLVATAWNVSRVSSLGGELSRLNADIAGIQSKLAAKPHGISDADYDRQKVRIRFYNDIIERKSLNWLQILELFESVTPAGVSLASLAPGKKLEEWKLEGRAKSFNGVQQFLEKLDSSKNFSKVLLLSHQNITSGEKMHGIQFSISCTVRK